MFGLVRDASPVLVSLPLPSACAGPNGVPSAGRLCSVGSAGRLCWTASAARHASSGPELDEAGVVVGLLRAVDACDLKAMKKLMARADTIG